MREMGLKCKTLKKFLVTTDSKHNEPVAPNLLNRKLDVNKPNTVWTSDITYLGIDARFLCQEFIGSVVLKKVEKLCC